MAPETYVIDKGELLELNMQHSKKYTQVRLLAHLRRIVIAAGIAVGSFIITWFVYSKSVFPPASTGGELIFSLQKQITTGSLFATFGSALIAVFTLFTGSSWSRFQEDLFILENELSGGIFRNASWKRWPFIPHVTKWSKGGAVRYFGVNTAKIRFKTGVLSQDFPLPTTEADFKDISVLVNYLQLRCLRKTYFAQLTDTNMREYPAWDCVTDIYRSILYYRVCRLCVWIGVSLVLQSIAFAFFYPYLYQIFAPLWNL